MIKIDAKGAKKTRKEQNRRKMVKKKTRKEQNRRKMVKKRLEKSKMKISHKSILSQINITFIIV